MANSTPLTTVPKGLIDCPITPFDVNNQVDLETFGRVVEFLVGNKPSSLCVNLHLAESLNLSLQERRILANAAVEVSSDDASVDS